MPELPEVETVRRGLAELLPGRVVKKATVFDSPKSFPNTPADVEQFLYGAHVTAVRRRAKVLMIDLDSRYSLVVHLKMTGQLVFRSCHPAMYRRKKSGRACHRDPDCFPMILEGDKVSNFAGGHPNDSLVGELPDRSTRVQIDFADGSQLFFNDQRKFGWMKLLPTAEVQNLPFMQKVGPKPAFLDQSVIAGVGNIYADEALWAARIHPQTRVRNVTDEQLNTLFIELCKILQLSIDQGGSTDRNYVDAEGQKGNYLAFANVFRREGQACRRHPDQDIIKLKVAGRGTHICPACQVEIK